MKFDICVQGALQHEKNKVSLRNLSMTLRQIPVSVSEEKISNVEAGLGRGKEAVGLDTADGQSWSLLGNAYLCHFFQVMNTEKNNLWADIFNFAGVTKSQDPEAGDVCL